MSPENVKFFKTTKSLRAWFEKNHKKKTELWIGYYRKETGRKTISWSDAVDEALCFGWIDGIRKKVDDISYSSRFTPRKPKSLWSKINVEKVVRLTHEGRMTEAGLAAVEHGKKSGNWDAAYRLKDGIDLPEDFKRALNKNKKAKAFFESLSNSNKHSYVNHVAMVKVKDKRIERVKQVIELLEMGIKPYIGQKRALSVYFK